MYSAIQIGQTGPSANIGGSSEYHIDTKFSENLPWEGIRDRFDALASKYREGGRNIEFSNAGVADLIYDLDASPEERLALLQKAAGAHAQRDGFHSFDYYAPTIGNNRFHKSAEGAPIYVVGAAGRKAEGGTGGNYGNYGVVLGDDGSVLSKSGHGDNSQAVFAGATFEGRDIATNKPAYAEAKNKAQTYAQMSKTQMNAEYDRLRASDPAKAASVGMQMHKAYFNK